MIYLNSKAANKENFEGGREMKTLFAGAVLVIVLMVSSASFAGNDDLEKGLKYYGKRDFRRAEASLEKYVSEVPDPVGYYLLGYAEYKLKKFGEARGHFSEAYLIDPDVSPKADTMLKRCGRR
jgi:TolA-binding protein